MAKQATEYISQPSKSPKPSTKINPMFTNKRKQRIRIGLILLILVILLITNYTEIKSGIIDGWNSAR